MNLESQLLKLGYDQPPVPKSLALYIPSQITGNLVITSGQLPIKAGDLISVGKVGSDLLLEHTKLPAEIACINALERFSSVSVISPESKKSSVWVSMLHRIRILPTSIWLQIMQVQVLIEIFGREIGQHARFAIGVASLPLNAPLELELTAEFL